LIEDVTIMNEAPDIGLYDLSAAQMSHLLKQYGLTPQTGSPLGGCAVLDPEPAAGEVPPREALQCLALPQRVLAVSCWPPQEAPVRWYYGRDDRPDLVQHEAIDSGRQLLVWPVASGMVAEVMQEPLLRYASDVAAGGFRLQTNRDGLLLLAALCDALQEQDVRGFLQRSAADEAPLGPSGLQQAVRKTLAADDLRWSAARFSSLAPTALAQGPAGLEPAIERFLHDNLLRPEGGGYRPTPPLAEVCRRWNAADAFSAVTRRRLSLEGRWEWEHLAFLHAAGGMFRFEFADIGSGGYTLTISEVDGREILEWDAVAAGQRPVAAASSGPGEIQPGRDTCRACGAELRPGTGFCTQCGTAVTPEGDLEAGHGAAPAEWAHCGNCGSGLKPGARFCTQCGERVV